MAMPRQAPEEPAKRLWELLQVDPATVDLRRGLIRVLLVAASLFWLFAAGDILNAYRSAPLRPDGWILRTEAGSYYQVGIPAGQTCESAIGGIAKDFAARGMGVLPADACARHEANRQVLRAQDGRRAAMDGLIRYAIGFVIVAGLIGAVWWTARGFLVPRRPEKGAS